LGCTDFACDFEPGVSLDDFENAKLYLKRPRSQLHFHSPLSPALKSRSSESLKQVETQSLNSSKIRGEGEFVSEQFNPNSSGAAATRFEHAKRQ
jgi:hypothetical protein